MMGLVIQDEESQLCCQRWSWDDMSPRVRRLAEIVSSILLPLLPAVLVVISSLVLLVQNVESYNRANAEYEAFDSLSAFGEVLESLHHEMESIANYIATNRSEVIDDRGDSYSQTDMTILTLPQYPELYLSNAEIQKMLVQHRKEYRNSTVLDEISFYTNLITNIVEASTYLIQQDVPRYHWKKVLVFHSLCSAFRDLTIEKALGSVYFFSGFLTIREYSIFLAAYETGIIHLENSAIYDEQHREYIQGIASALNESLDVLRRSVTWQKSSSHQIIDGIGWNRKYSDILDELISLIHLVIYDVKNDLNEMLETLGTSVAFMVVVIIVMIFLLSPFIIISAHRSMSTLAVYTYTMDQKSRELQRQKRRTERLIKEMLPAYIAYRMMKGEVVDAEYFDSVTVFFSDISDFNEISMASSPFDIVAFLNDIYNLIDAHLERYDVYKVETISCVYMVVSGMPMRNGARHVTEIAKLALNIMEVTEQLSVPHMPDRGLQLRIGAHTGMVARILQSYHF